MARHTKSYDDNCKRWALLRRLRSLMQRSYKLSIFFVTVLIISLFALVDFTHSEEKEMGIVSRHFYDTTAAAGMRLELVTFEGDRYIGQAELVEDLELFNGIPILALDLDELRKKVKERNWVKDAQIHRELPSKLEITIVEREPIAIWQHKRELHLIDEDGVVLTKLDSADGLPFPLIVGEGANKNAKEIFDILATEKTLYNRMEAAVRVNDRRWNITFMNGIEVLMPEENFAEAWKKLGRLQIEKNVLDREVEQIDLRMSDRVYIKTKNESDETTQKSGSSSA